MLNLSRNLTKTHTFDIFIYFYILCFIFCKVKWRKYRFCFSVNKLYGWIGRKTLGLNMKKLRLLLYILCANKIVLYEDFCHTNFGKSEWKYFSSCISFGESEFFSRYGGNIADKSFKTWVPLSMLKTTSIIKSDK